MSLVTDVAATSRCAVLNIVGFGPVFGPTGWLGCFATYPVLFQLVAHTLVEYLKFLPTPCAACCVAAQSNMGRVQLSCDELKRKL
jgi:hypothetical protein